MNNFELNFAKIVANPTPTSWSQAYNAGNLFAVLSLKNELLEGDKDESLSILGKNIIDSLEKEYYATEEKNLESIKNVVNLVLEKIPDEVKSCLVVGTIIHEGKNILYVFCHGEGKAMIKRGEKFGVILSQSKDSTLEAASGFLEDDDMIILETNQFGNVISNSELSATFDHLPPSEIAEALSPKVHEKEEGGASAIILSYRQIKIDESVIEEEEEAQQDNTDETLVEKENEEESAKSFIPPFRIKFPSLGKFQLNHSRKVILTIALLLIVVLGVSIFFAVKKREESQNQTIFTSIYPEAEKKYNEGEGLIDLNKNLAKDDFSKAQKILEDGKNKLTKNSKEEKQVLALLDKVNSALTIASDSNLVDAKKVDDTKSLILSFEKTNDLSLTTFDDKNFYGISDKEIFSQDKKTDSKKTLVKNNKDWTSLGGFGIYLGNFYVLDKSDNQIFKFASKSFAKTNYLVDKIDVSNAASITIDGSIYILSDNGTISKFTKGKSDNFKIAGLDTPLKNPSRIFTNVDANNLYILDNGNSRIVILDKKGNYVSEYKAKILTNAKDFEVLESSKKIYVLSDTTVYEIDIK